MLPPKWTVQCALTLWSLGFMLLYLSGQPLAIIPACLTILAQIWLAFP